MLAANALPTHPQIDTHDQCTTTNYSINYYLRSRHAFPSGEGGQAKLGRMRSNFLSISVLIAFGDALLLRKSANLFRHLRCHLPQRGRHLRFGASLNSYLSSRSSNLKPSLLIFKSEGFSFINVLSDPNLTGSLQGHPCPDF